MSNGGGTIKVLVVDDHEVVRRGLCEYLGDKDWIEVSGAAETATEALALIQVTEPDVALLDVRLPDTNGITLCREIRDSYPGIRCLMLTSFADEEAMLQAIVAGAVGYVLKDAPLDQVLEAIKVVSSGGSPLDPSLVDRMRDRLRNMEADSPLSSLTEQERKIFELMASGAANRQIAADMSLAEPTVKNYVSSILGKLGLARRGQAAALAAELNMAAHATTYRTTRGAT